MTAPGRATSAPPVESTDLARAAFSLIASGAIVVPVAALALRWPEPALVLGMVVAGGVVGTFGVVDLAVAVVGRRLAAARAFYVGHGLSSVAFGIVTGAIPVAHDTTATRLSIAWLVAYALLLGWMAWRLAGLPLARVALLGWGTVNLGLGLLLLMMAPMPALALLYAGAAYTVALGAAHVVAGGWTQHLLARRTAAARAPRHA